MVNFGPFLSLAMVKKIFKNRMDFLKKYEEASHHFPFFFSPSKTKILHMILRRQ